MIWKYCLQHISSYWSPHAPLTSSSLFIEIHKKAIAMKSYPVVIIHQFIKCALYLESALELDTLYISDIGCNPQHPSNQIHK